MLILLWGFFFSLVFWVVGWYEEGVVWVSGVGGYDFGLVWRLVSGVEVVIGGVVGLGC